MIHTCLPICKFQKQRYSFIEWNYHDILYYLPNSVKILDFQATVTILLERPPTQTQVISVYSSDYRLLSINRHLPKGTGTLTGDVPNNVQNLHANHSEWHNKSAPPTWCFLMLRGEQANIKKGFIYQMYNSTAYISWGKKWNGCPRRGFHQSKAILFYKCTSHRWCPHGTAKYSN